MEDYAALEWQKEVVAAAGQPGPDGGRAAGCGEA